MEAANPRANLSSNGDNFRKLKVIKDKIPNKINKNQKIEIIETTINFDFGVAIIVIPFNK